jgi:hypothetical protein
LVGLPSCAVISLPIGGAAFEATYTPAKKKKHPTPATLAKLSRAWSRQIILHLWAFSKTIWAARNAVVHGKTDLTLSKDILQLHQSVTYHYTQYQADPHYVLSHHTYLFNRPLNTMLTYHCNTLSCWICSIEEAVQTQVHRSMKANKAIKHYFQVSAARKPTPSQSLASIFHPPFSTAYYAQQALRKSAPPRQPRAIASKQKAKGKKLRSATSRKPSKTPGAPAPVQGAPLRPIQQPHLTRKQVASTTKDPAPNSNSSSQPSTLSKASTLALSPQQRKPSAAKPKPSAKQRARQPASSSQKTTHHTLGFTITRNTLDPSALCRRQLDKLTRKTENSGTFVSTTP